MSNVKRLSASIRIVNPRDNCASARRLKPNRGGVTGSSFCEGRPPDFQPHLVTVNPGLGPDATLDWWSGFDRKTCLHMKKEADDPKGKYVSTEQIQARLQAIRQGPNRVFFPTARKLVQL